MTAKKVKNPHDEHRQRLKNRYLMEGLDSFYDYQALELLLCYAIPRKDVNYVAHDLIEHFGSLSAVFEAEISELKEINGIGDHSAILLNLMPKMWRLYQKEKYSAHKLMDSPSAWGEYAKTLFIGRTNEVFYLICLDTQHRLNHAALLQEGTINEVLVYPRRVVEAALRHKAKSVILAHNHPGGSLRPTTADMDITWQLADAMYHINVDVLDHIIVAGDRYVSFAEKGLLHR